jgi:hypothetical protein
LKGAFNEPLKLKFMLSDFSFHPLAKRGKNTAAAGKGIPTKVICSFTVIGSEQTSQSFFSHEYFPFIKTPDHRREEKTLQEGRKVPLGRALFAVVHRNETEKSDSASSARN